MEKKAEKELQDKAIKVSGKDYIQVVDRVIFFKENYPKGAIQTELLSATDSDRIVFRATVYPDTEVETRYFTGHAQEIVGDGFINKTSALENAETSAVGRALGMMGIGIIESIASADEIKKSEGSAVSTDEAERRAIASIEGAASLEALESLEKRVASSKMLLKDQKDRLNARIRAKIETFAPFEERTIA